ncbi:MAG: F0F1 ATP synthase subunit delta [Granulosicoccaceae bacterium]
MSELSTAARPYAKAVFEMAQSESDLGGWSETLGLLSAVASNDAMRQVLEAPAASRQSKSDALVAVCGDKLSDKAKNLIKLMADNDRLSLLGDVATQFEVFKAESEGTVEAVVRTAMNLDDSQKNRIAEALGKRLNRKVNVVCVIDESLLGGAIIQANDLVIDGSIKGKLDKLGQALTH